MRCEECHGEGTVPANFIQTDRALTPEQIQALRRKWEQVSRGLVPRASAEVFRIPCPECGGCGFAHCCEGERPEGAR
jgi:hypothetical protein